MHNDMYEGLLEGRYPFAIDLEELQDGGYKASFVAPSGEEVTVEDSSRNEAHRLCTAKVVEGIKNGTIVPFF